MNKIAKACIGTALTTGLLVGGVGVTGAVAATTPQRPPLTITWVCPAPYTQEIWITFSGMNFKGCQDPVTKRTVFFRG